MAKIRFTNNSCEWVVDAPVGASVMQAAVAEGVPGIIAECGGNAMCATCHVYVTEGGDALPPVSPAEDDMLDCAAEDRLETSRLACQLPVTQDIDGLEVEVAAD